jgi:hypothetical protein
MMLLVDGVERELFLPGNYLPGRRLFSDGWGSHNLEVFVPPSQMAKEVLCWLGVFVVGKGKTFIPPDSLRRFFAWTGFVFAGLESSLWGRERPLSLLIR